MKILSVVGARPNFVKIAAVLAETRKLPWIRTVLVHTGQHYDPEMSGWFFRDLGIPQPDVNLRDCMSIGVDAAAPGGLAAMAQRLEPVLRRESPDVVLVAGDVNSTLAGALAAARLGIPIAHLEAGLRSFDLSMPEEINRITTDAVSDLLFVTEPSGVCNLLNEGKRGSQIFLTGNVMIDTLKRLLPSAVRSTILERLCLRKSREDAEIKKYVLVTLHRAAAVDSPEILRTLWGALNDIAAMAPVIFPIHPRTAKRFKEAGLEALSLNHEGDIPIRLIPPLGYIDFLCLEKNASLVITDSGGVQEETTALGVPCLTARESTERPITVSDGTNTIAGLDPNRLRDEARRILSGHIKTGRAPDLWDGHAAQRVLKILMDTFMPGPRAPYAVTCRPLQSAQSFRLSS
ncbi:MAG: non-hydrolyzing UDP-N-acetylglucosamine 2-epimerase [Terriglobia bacterium]